MTKRISRVAPLQAGKLCAVIYFGFSLFFVILFALFNRVLPAEARPHLGVISLVLLPFLYALAGLIFGAFAAWIYNIAAGLVGGLEISLSDEANA